MFDGPLPDFANTRSLRVAVGLGTIPRVVGDAQPIYREPLPVDEGLARIEALHRPYHARLAGADRARAAAIRSRAADRLPFHAEQRRRCRRLGHRARRPVTAPSAARWIVETLEASAAGVGLSGAAQQALCRRLHHRALRRARRRRPRGADRDHPGALPGRARDRATTLASCATICSRRGARGVASRGPARGRWLADKRCAAAEPGRRLGQCGISRRSI